MNKMFQETTVFQEEIDLTLENVWLAIELLIGRFLSLKIVTCTSLNDFKMCIAFQLELKT